MGGKEGSCFFSLPAPGLLHGTAQFCTGCCGNRTERSPRCCCGAGSGAGRQPTAPLSPGLQRDRGGVGVIRRPASDAEGWSHGRDRPRGVGRGRPGLYPLLPPPPSPTAILCNRVFFFFFFLKERKQTVTHPATQARGAARCTASGAQNGSKKWTEPRWLQLERGYFLKEKEHLRTESWMHF